MKALEEKTREELLELLLEIREEVDNAEDASAFCLWLQELFEESKTRRKKL